MNRLQKLTQDKHRTERDLNSLRRMERELKSQQREPVTLTVKPDRVSVTNRKKPAKRSGEQWFYTLLLVLFAGYCIVMLATGGKP